MLRLKLFFQHLFLWPGFGGIATIAGVIAGYLGSHYDKEIAAASYPFFWPRSQFQSHPSLFWLVTILFGASFTGTFWAQARRSEEATAELRAALRELYTLPPKGFLHTYRKLVCSAAEFSLVSAQSLQLKQLQLAIRTQLGFICDVVAAFDSDGVRAIYGCNVMRYLASSSAEFQQQKMAIQARTKCIENGVDVGNLEGVLDLRLELSMKSNGAPGPDLDLVALALPIPRRHASTALQEHIGIVPGAPYAFSAGCEVVFSDQNAVIGEMTNNRLFSSTVIDELSDLLNVQADRVQSLICIPLYAAPHQVGVARTPVGVLNIHRNLPNKHAREKFELLSPLLAPMVHMVGCLVARHP